MEGLEATEVKFSELKTIIDYRIEAEYFLKKFTQNDTTLQSIPCSSFIECFDFVNGRPYNSDAFEAPISKEGYLSVAKIGDVTNKRGKETWEVIPYEEFISQRGVTLTYGDILMTLTGDPPDVGKVHFCFDKMSNCTWNQRVAKVSIKGTISNPEYGYILLSSEYCRIQLERYAKGIRQRNLGNEGFEKLLIPQLSEDLQYKVQELVQVAFENYRKSQSLYSSAENYLLECLGMQDFVANPDTYNIKTLKESFLESGRIDAEYYLPEYDDLEKLIASFEYAKLADLCTLIDHGKQPPYVEGGEIRVFSQKWIGDKGIDYGFIDSTEEPMTSCSFARDNSEYVCRQNDIVYYSVGANIGYCHNYLSDVPMMPGSFITIIRANESKINPLYLGFVLNSFIGRTQAEKRKSGTAQPYIYPKDLKEFIIPLIRPEVQAEIAQHIQRSFALRREASQLLEEAKLSVEHAIEMGGGKLLIYSRLQNVLEREERSAMYLLLKELGLIDEKLQRHEIVATEKKFSASFATSGRLDAEYYQPKYDYLDSQLAQLSTKYLGELVELCKSIEPGSEAYQAEGVPFVRVADLNKFGIETPSVCLDRATYATAPRPQKDTILLSKDGSVGIAYKVEDDMDVITSGAILHLSVKAKGILPDYLTLVLNSPIVKMQAERDAGGSIIQHWKPSEIAQVVIPILPIEIQQKLSEQVSKSFALRRDAHALLGEAKAMVERAIEPTA